MSTNADANKIGLPAGEFEEIFQKAGVLNEQLANAKSARSKATKIGNFLAPHVRREVPVNVKGRTGRATLCVREGRGNKKLYYFRVEWDEPATESTSASRGTVALSDGLDQVGDNRRRAGEAAPTNAAGSSMKANGSTPQAGGNREEW